MIYGGNGNDNIRGLGGEDYIEGNAGNDRIRGNDGNDTIYGQEGEDRLSGGRGNDLLFGGTQGDELWGDQGNDTLYGNEECDYFVFYNFEGTGIPQTGYDIIADWDVDGHGDLISFWGYGANLDASTLYNYASFDANGQVTFNFGNGNVIEVRGSNFANFSIENSVIFQ